ncbi:unnamed protein product [Bursaphelenchus okinawaensis]|uniref:G-protein coupled receptors family 1 profile domain-containing protein n=1 Tax=Bursaphelenchus okinawaensis TaxID=465554 RepID=A0A811L1Q9_9BILA|nr:unnamed protein product [Bursaphelenchus okinawaensis]CAG9115278.1 unnamed protein product [Bursaphelenchus okinawaensis]
MVAPLNVNKSPIRYTKCFQNATLEERQSMATEIDGAIWERVLYWHHGIYPIPFTVVAIIGVVLYILCVKRAMDEHRVSRKFYSLLLNRAFGDFVACIANTVAILYALCFEHNPGILQILNTLFIASFWSSMCSYTGQSIIKLYGVAKPLQYRRYITMKRCKQFCVLSWILFFTCIIYTSTVVVITTVPSLRKLTDCTSESCLHPMYSGRNILVVVVYLFTLATFGFTVLLIRRAKKHSESFHQSNNKNRDAVKRRFKYPMLKLAIHILTFTVFNFPYFCWALLLVVEDGCFYPKHYNTMNMFSSWVRMSLCVRIIVDSLLSLCFETEVKRSLLKIFGCVKRVVPSASLSTNRMTTINSGTGTVSACDSSDYSNADNVRPLTAEEKKQQRSVSERGLLHKTHLKEPGDIKDAKQVIEVIPE